MTKNGFHTRRIAVAGGALAISAMFSKETAALASPLAVGSDSGGDPSLDVHRHDWDWLVGRWNVRHRRLKQRLAGNTEWEEFGGTSVLWLTLGGLGTIDDNVIEIPSGTYRAVTIRAFDPATRKWSIWWLDARNPTRIEPPVLGGFSNGVGRFMGDDAFNGRPIKVRFIWSQITDRSARWEQAFSPDGGASWETNWIMHFSRA